MKHADITDPANPIIASCQVLARQASGGISFASWRPCSDFFGLLSTPPYHGVIYLNPPVTRYTGPAGIIFCYS